MELLCSSQIYGDFNIHYRFFNFDPLKKFASKYSLCVLITSILILFKIQPKLSQFVGVQSIVRELLYSCKMWTISTELRYILCAYQHHLCTTTSQMQSKVLISIYIGNLCTKDGIKNMEA